VLNIVILMTDDAGFSNLQGFGGPVRMPTMAELVKEGIAYNAFHSPMGSYDVDSRELPLLGVMVKSPAADVSPVEARVASHGTEGGRAP
jgi:hypothetical protein